MGSRYLGVLEISLCQQYQEGAWLPRLEITKVGHKVCDGWISSPRSQTGCGTVSPVMVDLFCQLVLIPESNLTPLLDVIISPWTKQPIDSRGYILPGVSPSMPSIAILCLAAWLQIQLSCAFWLTVLKDALLS
jgi:hypothetical protein